MSDRPDGRILFTHDTGVWQWSPDGIRRLTDGKAEMQPSWSPDGIHFAYISMGRNSSDLMIKDAETERVYRLTQNSTLPRPSTWAYRPAWSPDGELIAYVSDAVSYHPVLWLIRSDGTRNRLLGRWGDGFGGSDGPSWAPDSTEIALSVFLPERTSQIFLIDPMTVQARQLTSMPGNAYDPAISPTKREIAFSTLDEAGSQNWIAPLDGGEPVAIPGSKCRTPVWSPDGNWIAYIGAISSDKFGVFGLRVDAGLGQTRPTLLTGDLAVSVNGGLSWGA
jgi:Tol biopolymer transport system component